MKSSCHVILDNTNYFQWWSYIVDLLRSKGLYRIVSGQETKPKDEDKVAKWENRQDQARGLIGMSIYPDFRFHIAELDTPNEAMKQLTKFFGIKNEIRHHQLENKLLTLDPNNFSFIEDFLSKFKTLRILLEGVKVKKEDGSLIYSILVKLGPAYSVFVSTFHSTRKAFISQGQDYKSPSFDAFCDSLIREQKKLLHLGLLNLGNSSKKALATQKQPNSKDPKKKYPKKNGHEQFQCQNEKSIQQNDKANNNKGRKTNRHCNFCNRDGHLESKCFKKMEALEAATKKHNIHLEHSSTSTSSSGITLYACGCQASWFGYALNVSSSSHSHEWLIDSRASYHMAKNKAMFSSLNDYVKGYRLIPLKSKNFIIRRYVKFVENISAYEPSSVDVPPLFIPSTSENISSSDDDLEDDNPPPPSQDPPSAPRLPKWVCATWDAAGDPTNQQRTCSQFDKASSLLAQASVNYDLGTFAEASGHPDWDVAMNEEYCSSLANDTWDLVPLPKGRKLVRCKWVYKTKFGPDGKVDKK
eukprot:PITA_33909